jgi:methyl-accepting chemotaxis protein
MRLPTWNDLSLRTRLMTTFAAVVILSSLVGAFAVVQLGRVNANNANVTRRALPSVSALRNIGLATARFRMATLQFVAASKAEQAAASERMDKALEAIEHEQKLYEPLIASTFEKQTYNEFMSAWSDYMMAHATALGLVAEGHAVQARAVMAGEAQTQFDAASARLGALIEQNRLNAEAAQATSEAIAHSARWWVVALMLGVLVVSGGLAWVVVGGVNRLLDRVASDIAGSAETLIAAATETSRASEALSRSASDQASSLDEATGTMAQISTTTRTNARHAHDADALVTEADTLIRSSNVALEAMVTSMAGIEDASSRVTRIIRTIDEIAFQTNILALNAAVEAARAGEAGMGFAVVADEVRTLAQRSAQAAKETEALIEESIARTGEGAARVQDVARGISSITGSVSQLEALVGEVQEASRQQSAGIAQVSQAIGNVERGTQATAATAEETAFASAALNGHAETSMVVVGRLARLVERARAAVAGRPAKGGNTRTVTKASKRAASHTRPARTARPRSRNPLRRAS